MFPDGGEMNIFKPSNYFFGMISILKNSLMFQDSAGFAIFLWVFLPVLPFTVLGWYLADIMFCRGYHD